MYSFSSFYLAAATLVLSLTSLTAFAPVSNHHHHHHQKQHLSRSSSTARSALLLGAAEITDAIDASRGEFFLWFFGASGSAGIARGQFPKMFGQVQTIQGLKGVGPTLGGPSLGLNPLCGYPQDLAVADVEQIVSKSNKLSVQNIIDKFPNDGTFLAQQGYLTYAAFCAANKDSNPLAVRAIFDSFGQSTDACDPKVAAAKLESYAQAPSKLNGQLLASKVSGWAAIAILLFLLGLADIVALGHAYEGWFPDWPGGRNFPFSLLDEDGSLFSIPKYWI